MELLFENNDTLIYLLKIIYDEKCKQQVNNSELQIMSRIKIYKEYGERISMLYKLCHTSRDLRKIILNNFQPIKMLMLEYKRLIILPKLSNELKIINNRKFELENRLKILPMELMIERDIQFNFCKIYINYKNKKIHYSDCNYCNVNENMNLQMNKFKNDNKIDFDLTNPITLNKLIENFYYFVNFKICNNSQICKCLHKEVKDILQNKLTTVS